MNMYLTLDPIAVITKLDVNITCVFLFKEKKKKSCILTISISSVYLFIYFLRYVTWFLTHCLKHSWGSINKTQLRLYHAG